MRLSLPDNISRLRKEHCLTQEQLAEALGVTFASVSKWERGVATPELSLIAEMADIFGVSLDALVGFEVRNGEKSALENRIKLLQKEKKYESAISEAEKALLRYQNDFHILYVAAQTYEFAGLEHPDKKQYLYRAIELLERAIVLLSQNNDPEISEVSIKKEVALCYITLGNNKKGIDILKKFNVCGIYDPLIAITYTQNKEFDNKEAEPYITSAFRNILVDAISSMSAFANYFYKKADYLSSKESLIWLIDMLQNTKTDQKAVAFFDKIIAPCYFQCANLSLLLGENEKIEKYLRMAYKTAEAFDNAPTFKMDNIKFNLEDTNKAIVYDNLGNSAFASIEKLISEDIKNKDLIKAWKKIVEEHALEVNNEK